MAILARWASWDNVAVGLVLYACEHLRAQLCRQSLMGIPLHCPWWLVVSGSGSSTRSLPDACKRQPSWSSEQHLTKGLFRRLSLLGVLGAAPRAASHTPGWQTGTHLLPANSLLLLNGFQGLEAEGGASLEPQGPHLGLLMQGFPEGNRAGMIAGQAPVSAACYVSAQASITCYRRAVWEWLIMRLALPSMHTLPLL